MKQHIKRKWGYASQSTGVVRLGSLHTVFSDNARLEGFLTSVPCKIYSLKKSFYRSTVAFLSAVVLQISGHGWAD